MLSSFKAFSHGFDLLVVSSGTAELSVGRCEWERGFVLFIVPSAEPHGVVSNGLHGRWMG